MSLMLVFGVSLVTLVFLIVGGAVYIIIANRWARRRKRYLELAQKPKLPLTTKIDMLSVPPTKGIEELKPTVTVTAVEQQFDNSDRNLAQTAE